jgi:hypothetical protein
MHKSCAPPPADNVLPRPKYVLTIRNSCGSPRRNELEGMDLLHTRTFLKTFLRLKIPSGSLCFIPIRAVTPKERACEADDPRETAAAASALGGTPFHWRPQGA